MYDKNLLLRDGTVNLTATETGAAVDYSQAGHWSITFEMTVPQATGTTPTLDAKIQVSDNGTTWRDWLFFRQATAAGVYHVTGANPARYRRMVATVGGTTPDFGKVTIGAVTGGAGTSF